MSRIYLSPPHLGGRELELLADAIASNWIAPLGPHVDAFERELAAVAGAGHAAALSSGTGALHLAMKLVGVRAGDEVVVPTLTFAASAFAAVYEGAVPLFVDVDRDTWTLDPVLLRAELAECAARQRLPAAVVTVDLYGQCADYDAIEACCLEYGVPLIADAAEALGASYRGRPAGGFGRFGVLSFNGNKIITTSGGGALLSDDGDAIALARKLASQARDPAPHYQHSSIGYNYRLSNLLAAVGRAQLESLADRVTARRRNFEVYRQRLGGLPGISFMPEAAYGRSTRWLSVMLIDEAAFGASPEQIRVALESEDIEARPVWKPLHQQPVFAHCRIRGGAVADELFATGLCLPSGSSLSAEDLDRICTIVNGLGN